MKLNIIKVSYIDESPVTAIELDRKISSTKIFNLKTKKEDIVSNSIVTKLFSICIPGSN